MLGSSSLHCEFVLATKQAVWLIRVVTNRLRLKLNFALRFAAWNSEVDLSIKTIRGSHVFFVCY